MQDDQRGGLDISVVIPCLNEEMTIARCVEKARRAIAIQGLRGEVIVVDNGSTDASARLADAAGARVVSEARPGYGSAYLRGLAEARGRLIFLGDGDGTYDFEELPAFLSLAEGGADLVLGSRLKGRIHPGAMPWHHRWIGNPGLTAMLNVLFGVGVSDAHCGLRLLRRSALPALALRSTGMEFASEMVINAARADLRIAETPIVYYARPSNSPSKLKAFSDGLRHVRYMLAHAPGILFWGAAGSLLVVGVATQGADAWLFYASALAVMVLRYSLDLYRNRILRPTRSVER